jgi:hypothetical protein
VRAGKTAFQVEIVHLDVGGTVILVEDRLKRDIVRLQPRATAWDIAISDSCVGRTRSTKLPFPLENPTAMGNRLHGKLWHTLRTARERLETDTAPD